MFGNVKTVTVSDDDKQQKIKELQDQGYVVGPLEQISGGSDNAETVYRLRAIKGDMKLGRADIEFTD